MNGHGQFCPVAVACEVFAHRWTPLILRELFATPVDRGYPENLDAELLMWNVRRRLALDRLPAERTVVRFDFSGLPPRYRRGRVFWLIAERVEVDLCLKDPGAEVDLYVSADLGSFARIWLGDMPFSEAVRTGSMRLTGRRDLVRKFPSWLLLSHFAEVPRPWTEA